MVRSSGLDCDILKLLESKKSSVLFSAFQNQSNSATANPLSRGTLATLRAVIAAGLYPNVAKLSYVQPVDHAARPTKTICTGKTAQGPFPVHPRSINRFLATNGWLVFQEKVCCYCQLMQFIPLNANDFFFVNPHLTFRYYGSI